MLATGQPLCGVSRPWLSGEFGAPLGDLAAVAEEFGDPGRGTSATRLPSAQLRGEGGLGGFNHLLKSWASRLT